MPLAWQFASYADVDDLAAFACWDGDPAKPWEEEVENHIRGWVLRQHEHVLTFRHAGELVAVSAFDPRFVGLPLVRPIDQPAWHLQVVAVRTESQGAGLVSEVLAGTFAAMQSVDTSRVLITATAHRENAKSLRVCAKVGLTWFRDIDEHYVELLGEVPDA